MSDRATAALKQIGIDIASLKKSWKAAVSRYGSAQAALAFETKIAADQLGIPEDDLPCVVLSWQGTRERVSIPAFAVDAPAGAASIGRTLRDSLTEQEVDRVVQEVRVSPGQLLSMLGSRIREGIRGRLDGDPRLNDTKRAILKTLLKAGDPLLTREIADRLHHRSSKSLGPELSALKKLKLIGNPHRGYALTSDGLAVAKILVVSGD